MTGNTELDGTTIPTKESLRGIRIFSELDDGRLSRIAEMSRLVCQPAGSIVLEEQGPADHVHGIVEGRVAIELTVPGQPGLAVSTVSQGGIVGWSALLSQQKWLATARTLKDTTLVVVQGDKLLALCEEDHELGYHVMHRAFEAVAQRLHDTWLQRLDSFGQ